MRRPGPRRQTRPCLARGRLALLAPLLVACGCVPRLPEAPPAQASSTVTVTRAPDRDGDGVLDDRDACPDLAGVAPDGCPEKDLDGDGFPDRTDRCPDESGVEPDGCPLRDTDRDGIYDPDDDCVDQPETRNGYGDADGCPDAIPDDLAKMTGPIRGLFFELDKDILRPDSRPALERAVRLLLKYPWVRLEISGHTDSTAMNEYCKDLSQRRAQSVKRYLVERGIEAERLETRGAGPDEPLDTNKTARGRARNRRIEFTILVQ